jgi:hypothetical protein
MYTKYKKYQCVLIKYNNDKKIPIEKIILLR